MKPGGAGGETRSGGGLGEGEMALKPSAQKKAPVSRPGSQQSEKGRSEHEGIICKMLGG
jgi:hypothetical protein